MAKIFNRMCDLVDRVPDYDNVEYLFWSLMDRLSAEDQCRLIADLGRRVASKQKKLEGKVLDKFQDLVWTVLQAAQ